MLQRMSVAPSTVKEPLPTQDGAISQIQPEVLPQVTPGTLPTTGKALDSSQNTSNNSQLRKESASNWSVVGNTQWNNRAYIFPQDSTWGTGV